MSRAQAIHQGRDHRVSPNHADTLPDAKAATVPVHEKISRTAKTSHARFQVTLGI